MSEPPPTLAVVGPILTAYDASRPRSVQITLGPSEIGNPCMAQLVRKLAGMPETPRADVPWAPLCGTWVHDGMATALAWYNEQIGRERFIIEKRVWLNEVEHGRGDAFDVDINTVIDWKYVGSTALHEADMGRADPQYQVQIDLYGLGHENAGRRVDFVRLVYLARSHDYWAGREWTRAYDRGRAQAALSRLAVAKGYARAVQAGLPIDQIPLDHEGCTWCPFHVPSMNAPSHDGCPGAPTAIPSVSQLLTRKRKKT